MTAQAAAAYLKSQLNGFVPRTGLILGTGLGGLAERIANPVIVDYGNIPDFPQSTVRGHAGRFVFGMLEGHPVACMQGRLHFYEGHSLQDLATPVRTLRMLGCDNLVVTNAAGSLREEMGPGSLMVIRDHINFVGVNPLIGPNDEDVGPRFFDVSDAYHGAYRDILRKVTKERTIEIHEGVYAWFSGPNFETPAEIRAVGVLGADAVGMSTVPECLTAVHAGMKVTAISVITNLAAGMTGATLSHDETLKYANIAAGNLSELIGAFVAQL